MNAYISILCDADLRNLSEDLRNLCAVVTVGNVLDLIEHMERKMAEAV